MFYSLSVMLTASLRSAGCDGNIISGYRWVPVPHWGLIDLAHRCIWKIKLCCSKEQWPGPRDVGWWPRKDKNWAAYANNDLQNETTIPGAQNRET